MVAYSLAEGLIIFFPPAPSVLDGGGCPLLFFFKKTFLFYRIYTMTFNMTRIIALIVVLSVVLLPFTINAQEPTAETFFEIGINNSENAEYSEAIDAFKHAVKLKPRYAKAYYQLGRAYFSLHRYSEAHEAYKNAVKHNSKYIDAYFSLGIISSMLGKDDEAITALKKVVRLSPRHAKAYFTLGNIYSELEKYEQAVDAYRKVVKLNSRDAAARYHLGVSYMQLRKQLLTSARKEYNALRKLDKDLAKDLEGKIKGK